QAKRDLAEIKARPVATQDRRTDNGDPFEAWLGSQNFSNAQREWLRSHRDLVTDPVKSKLVEPAHLDAVNNGKAGDSPDYFAHIEDRVATWTGAAPAATVTVETPETKPAAKRVSVAAPVTRAGSSVSS